MAFTRTDPPNDRHGRGDRRNRLFVGGSCIVAAAASLFMAGGPAEAGIVPTVQLATAANYSVVAASTVTNTGPSILGQSLGLAPGSAVVGFPPGTVLAPGTTEINTGPALQAQIDLTAAYIDAAARPVEFTQTNPDLVGQTLAPGVYAASAKAPLALSGQLVLDGQNNPDAVFIFQTDSTLITGSASTVELINGAKECNVFWQVGSSATLGTGSTFVGNILALASITVATGVTVHGRALARTGAVTLDTDTFTQPSCVGSTATTPTPTTTPATTTPETTPETTTTVATGAESTEVPTTTGPPESTPDLATVVTNPNAESSTSIDFTTITLPRTGNTLAATTGAATAALLAGLGTILIVRRPRRTS